MIPISNLSIETKLGTLSPETVKAAYEKLGWKPTSATYYIEDDNGVGCGCALSAFVEVNAPGSVSDDAVVFKWLVINEKLGITERQESKFSTGYHCPTNKHNLLDDEEEAQFRSMGYACRKIMELDGVERDH